MVGGGRPLLREIFGKPAPVGAKSPILNRYSLVAPQPYHLAKKVQLTLGIFWDCMMLSCLKTGVFYSQ